MNNAKLVRVNASKSYDILIGRGISDSLCEMLDGISKTKHIALFTEDHVNSLYGDKLHIILENGGYSVDRLVFPEGEETKNAGNLIKAINFLAEHRFNRKDMIVALGGGVIGDLSGFAAAVFLRGINFIQVPTTLLAAVDSSVGGKTAVDIEAGKNLMGAFHQPSLVCCDTAFLDTLDVNVRRDGFAEVIKYGVIQDGAFFDILKNIPDGDLTDIIYRCVDIKRMVVEEDEFEGGKRKLLNFGHTIGHAIEKLSNFEISHGSAVAKGMIIAARLGVKLGYPDYSSQIESVLTDYGFDLSCPYSADEIYDIALSDKKSTGKSIDMIIPETIGNCVIVPVRNEDLLRLLKEVC